MHALEGPDFSWHGGGTLSGRTHDEGDDESGRARYTALAAAQV